MPPICDTKCGSPPGNSGGGVYSATKINDPEQVVPAGVPTEADFTSTFFDIGPAITPDLADNALVIEQDGVYELTASGAWLSNGADSVFATAILVNGVILVSSSIEEAVPSAAHTLSSLVQLSAGDRITVQLLTTLAEATFGGTLSAEKRN
jgi:hypothetical protein